MIEPLVGLPVADTEPATATIEQQSRTRIHILTVAPAYQSATATQIQKLQKPEDTPTTSKLYCPEPKDKDEYYRQLHRQQQEQRKRTSINAEQQELLAVSDGPKSPPPPRPVNQAQLDTVKVLAEKMRKQGDDPDTVISEMAQNRPLETLTRNEVTRIIAELMRRTDGKMKAWQQQLVKSSKKQK